MLDREYYCTLYGGILLVRYRSYLCIYAIARLAQVIGRVELLGLFPPDYSIIGVCIRFAHKTHNFTKLEEMIMAPHVLNKRPAESLLKQCRQIIALYDKCVKNILSILDVRGSSCLAGSPAQI